jgi:hypothetical protein
MHIFSLWSKLCPSENGQPRRLGASPQWGSEPYYGCFESKKAGRFPITRLLRSLPAALPRLARPPRGASLPKASK